MESITGLVQYIEPAGKRSARASTRISSRRISAVTRASLTPHHTRPS